MANNHYVRVITLWFDACHQEHKEEIERHTLTDFAESATSHGDGSIRTGLEEMHALVVPDGGVLGGGRGVFEMLSEGLKVNGVSSPAHFRRGKMLNDMGDQYFIRKCG